MKVVLAIDSFKGTFSSRYIEDALSARLKALGVEVVSLPVADGGEGLVDVLHPVLGGDLITLSVTGPDGDKVVAQYLLKGDLAIVETAQAAGIALSKLHSAADTTTYGVGEMIRDAMSRGAKEVLLGLGGSATCDGGCGMAAALGWFFFNRHGDKFLPIGRTLKDIDRIVRDNDYPITALSDVTNPLYGPKGAAYVFAPQKGAGPEEVEMLDQGLQHLAYVLRSEDIAIIDRPMAGAAGGLGGMVHVLGGKLTRGIDRVLDLVGYDEAVRDADFVITGEGRLDSQSLDGKVMDGVVSRKGRARALALVGSCLLDDPARYGIEKVFETNPDHLPFEAIKGSLAADMDRAIQGIVEYIKGEL